MIDGAGPEPVKVLVMGQDLPYLVRFRGHLVRALVAGGNATVVATPDPEPATQPIKAMGAQYVQMQFSRAGMNPVDEIRSVARMRRVLTEIRPDVVFAYGAKGAALGLLAARLAGVRRRYAMMAGLGFAFIDDGRRSPKRLFARTALQFLYRLNFRSSQAVIFHNNEDRDELVRRGIVAGDRTVVVAGSGVDTRLYTAGEPTTDPTRFVFVGRLLRSKGVEELLEAARMLRQEVPSAEVVLVGGEDANPDRVDPELLRAAAARGDVKLVGHVTDVRPHLTDASVFVLPSYREGMPRSALEAMACGRTTIMTDVPGCREVVHVGKHGALVPVRDARGLADAMVMYARDPVRVVREGREARRTAESEFDVRRVTAAMLRALGLPGDADVE